MSIWAFETESEAALEFIFGLRTSVPSAALFGGIDPEHVKTFFDSFLHRHGLKVSKLNSGAPVIRASNPGLQPADSDRRKTVRAAKTKQLADEENYLAMISSQRRGFWHGIREINTVKSNIVRMRKELAALPV